jgi:hypothetical protein
VIPEFEPSGLLPQGVHWALWPEIVKRFGTNAHRKQLLAGLERGLADLRRARCPAAYLDGSFVTSKRFPKDYDVCYEMIGVQVVVLDPVFNQFENRCAAQKAKYLGEFRPAYARAEGPPLYRVFFNFFQLDEDTGNPKGIVGIKLYSSP